MFSTHAGICEIGKYKGVISRNHDTRSRPKYFCDAYIQDVPDVFQDSIGKVSEKPGEVSATKENIHGAKESTPRDQIELENINSKKDFSLRGYMNMQSTVK